MTKYLNYIVLSLFFSISLPVQANEAELCAPFKDKAIDKRLLNTMLKAATAGDLYRINPETSKAGFCIDSPIGVVRAKFSNFSGGLALNDFQANGTSLVHIDVDSLTTDSGLVEVMLKGESFLDTEKYPDIIFTNTGIEWISENKAVLKGDLTLHGITKTVAFYVTLQKKGSEVVNIKASTTIQRSEFGMYTLSSTIGDKVTICMEMDTHRYQASIN